MPNSTTPGAGTVHFQISLIHEILLDVVSMDHQSIDKAGQEAIDKLPACQMVWINGALVVRHELRRPIPRLSSAKAPASLRRKRSLGLRIKKKLGLSALNSSRQEMDHMKTVLLGLLHIG